MLQGFVSPGLPIGSRRKTLQPLRVVCCNFSHLSDYASKSGYVARSRRTGQSLATLNVFQVDAFTDRTFAGNPAGVVLGADGLTDRQMQAIARELNNSETAFVLEADADDHDVRIRFFTPTVEVPSCGHATIAAHYVRARRLGLPRCRIWQKIKAGRLPVDVDLRNGDYFIVMTH